MSYRTPDAAYFGIDDYNLAIRRTFIRLDEDDRAVLHQFIPWIKTVSAKMATQFYDWQFGFRPTADFFAEYARSVGLSQPELRAKMEQAGAGYIESVFEGSEAGWDLQYFNHRLHIGGIHGMIDLPFKWYVGSYCEWRRLVMGELQALFADDKQGAAKVLRVMASVEKVFNLDLQAIGDAFLMVLFSSMGFQINDVVPGQGQDRTEYLGQIKTQVSDLAAGVAASVADINANIESVAAASEELSVSSAEIAERTKKISLLSFQAAEVADEATGSITQLGDSSEQIQKVVASIASVADKTNLLALNATIEAARAGEAGTGFSVVANEVKGLANRTAEATSEIESKITAIRSEIDAAVGALSSIVERVKDVNELQSTMASAVDEQLSAIRELGQNLADASRNTSEIRDQVRVFERVEERTWAEA